MNFPKTAGQCKYMRVLQSHKPIIIATGPAGSGKTMFACQLAAENLLNRNINRLVLTRPIVGADEDMGYLPGEMERKMEPWTKPMIDVFENYLTRGQLEHHVHIEPLGLLPEINMLIKVSILSEIDTIAPYFVEGKSSL